MSPNGVSILILTKNEEKDLPGCLESISWSDDIHVFDSFSTDRTVEIAKTHGATVTQRPSMARQAFFGGNEAEHKNWGLRNIPFRHNWILQLDADERVPCELAQEIQRTSLDSSYFVAYRIRRRDFFLGTWLKHTSASPFNLRLFRPEKMRYERLVNPISIPDGPVGELRSYFDHFPFNKGMSHWFDRHNTYSSLEARQIMTNRRNQIEFSLYWALFATDINERRFHQKEAFYRLPARPLIKFFLLYFLKRGFLDGRAGFTYAILQSIYEYMIVLKTRELELS
ncbi:MAG: glycosyltransferase family 2 protein [Candidatus Ozemobacteraceae bacterium]